MGADLVGVGEKVVSTFLADPNIRSALIQMVTGVIAEVLNRRATDPQYLEKSDAAFAQLSSAQTDDEKTKAHLAIAALLAD